MSLERVTAICGRLPEWERVDIEAWGGEPTFRVRKKNFVFASKDGRVLSFKLDKDEARAVIASDPECDATGYGLGRHGWITMVMHGDPDEERWTEIEEWIRTSYTLVAPKTLARRVLADDGLA